MFILGFSCQALAASSPQFTHDVSVKRRSSHSARLNKHRREFSNAQTSFEIVCKQKLGSSRSSRKGIGELLATTAPDNVFDVERPFEAILGFAAGAEDGNETSTEEAELDVFEGFLLDLGLSGKQVERLRRTHPEVFSIPVEHAMLAVDDLRSEGVVDKELAKLVRTSPSVLSMTPRIYDVSYDKASIILSLLSQLGLSESEAGQLFRKFPQLLSVSVDKATHVINFLQSIGLSNLDICKCLRRSPLFTYSVEDNLEPKIQFLEQVGVPPERIARIIVSVPIFTYSVEANLIPKVDFLLSIGIPDHALGSVVTRFPQIFNLSVQHSLIPKIELLDQIGLAPHEIAKIIQSQPRVLSMSPGNVAAKVQYLLSPPMNGTIGDLVRYPAYLSLNLHGRVVPRLEFLHHLDRQRPGLSRMLACSDEAFAKSIARAPLEDFLAFKAHVAAREAEAWSEPESEVGEAQARSDSTEAWSEAESDSVNTQEGEEPGDGEREGGEWSAGMKAR